MRKKRHRVASPTDPVPVASANARTYYDLHASEYAQETQSVDLSALWRRFESRLTPQARVLDLGCGAGRDLRRFAAQGFTVIGIDRSYPLTRIARDFSGQAVSVADACALPFRDGCFDAVWTLATLVHIPRDAVARSLVELHRVLRSGGIAFTSVKQGRGELVDTRSRLNVLYEHDEWEHLLEANDLSVLESDHGTEHRRYVDGRTDTIKWINCIATRTR